MRTTLHLGMTLVCAVALSCGGSDAAVAAHDSGVTHPEAGSSHDTGAQRDTGRPGNSDAMVVTDAPADAAATPDAPPSSDAPSTSDAGTTKYDSDGPVKFSMMALTATNGSSSFTENAYIPSTSGMHPVVSFSPGLQQSSQGYATYVTRLASWGFVTTRVLSWRPPPSPTT
jgi:hypothetical protein